ncbi:nickel transporter [Oleiphilus sp. HI0078]|nr:nickel transporter [Oleiphilus sp. HI0043]KZY45766.1 nickel transporter [Oleiphilus sp. HI0050]KZY55780.1 nickel transporter [Oleiphilus sp. HI0061]KZY75926.1 nickel transporter [Oleiphilus sp. HI0068]KZY81448.1 nickel transporter [Oleiphilus sp. HI0069]KZY95859.1 nickel transporter [Oleiphilus sp. HI0072]KZZ19931.1 nickel transporter [Oleiphilus sp. HI0078]KZZ35746.1 nickel transporter [Oleiphilus sp. HI0117]KZZ39333.1 nickel transporter [Oleiphilus sp. HI0086]KZZ56876.1 nickel transpo
MHSKSLLLLTKWVVAISLWLTIASTANAHFQMIYTPDLLRSKGGIVELRMPFTHPAANGYVMAVDKPLAFYHIKKGKKKDLSTKLVESNWASAENTGISYESSVKLKGLGDNIFVFEMAPYLEKSEDVFIQQFAKTIINVGSLPSDWESDLNLPAEIVPLTKPYAIYEGGSFTGIVRSHGKPVPFAEIEVEYINYLPEMSKNAFSSDPTIQVPAEAFITMTIYADASGTFTFAIPKAGQWGFAALGVGPQKKFKGKELSQDAVIWVQAHELK